MFNMGAVTSYVCDKYYYVVYKNDNLIKHPIKGLLLNYASGNIVLLADEGIYHIQYKDIILMKPIKVFPLEKCSDEFQRLIKSFNNDSKSSVEDAMHDWAESYFKGAGDFMRYLLAYTRSGKPLYESDMEDILVEFAKQYGEVKEINT